MKAQASIEFLAAISVLLIIFTFVLAIYFNNNADVEFSKTAFEARLQCLKISGAINNVLAAGKGHSQKISLPDTINFKNYNVTVYSSSQQVQITWQDSTIFCPLAVGNVTNSTFYSFAMRTGEHSIQNLGDRIFVQKL